MSVFLFLMYIILFLISITLFLIFFILFLFTIFLSIYQNYHILFFFNLFTLSITLFLLYCYYYSLTIYHFQFLTILFIRLSLFHLFVFPIYHFISINYLLTFFVNYLFLLIFLPTSIQDY